MATVPVVTGLIIFFKLLSNKCTMFLKEFRGHGKSAGLTMEEHYLVVLVLVLALVVVVVAVIVI